jgi:hypothetical protein
MRTGGLRFTRKNGFVADDLELNDKAAEEALLKDIFIYSYLVENFKPTEFYDMVVLSN